jgi:hypothetical protein
MHQMIAEEPDSIKHERYQPRLMKGTTEVLRQKYVTMPIYPTQIPHIQCNNQNQITYKYSQLLPV